MKRTRVPSVLVAAATLGLVTAAGGTAAATVLAGHGHGPGSGPAPASCTAADKATCLLPFPNDYNTVPDPTSETGRRVYFTADAMPVSVLGAAIDPTEWNRQDGFSPGSPILVKVPGLDPAMSGIPDDTDIGASLDEDAAIVLLNTRTGQRTPYWAELDAHATASPDRQVLIIRPAVALQEATTYEVILRNLKSANGDLLPVGQPTAQYATGRTHPSQDGGTRMLANARRTGINPTTINMAWQFTVASQEGLTGRALAMRDSAFRALGTAAPAFTVTSVTAGDDLIARRITGTVSVPSYLTGNGGPGARLHYGAVGGDGLPADPDAVPTPSGATLQADFVCNIPASASADAPAHLSLYGHGLLGSPTEINSGANVETFANAYDFMFCATSWIGLASADIPFAAATFANLSNFPSIPDRLQQSFLNFLFLGRAMKTASGFASHPAFQDEDGRPLVDLGGGLHYDGNSQGGINGGALTALATDFTRAVLGVTGENYSIMLQRSVDFAPFQQLMDGYYPDPEAQQIIFGLLQMLWDRGEVNGYAQHVTRHPLPRTPKHTVLMQVAFADHQVANVASEFEARTLGAAIHQPVIDEGWSAQQVPFWGIPAIPSYPYRGSAITVWNSGGAFAPPSTNLAPADPALYGSDPHAFPRRDPRAQEQKAVFLLTGQVVNTCDGACP